MNNIRLIFKYSDSESALPLSSPQSPGMKRSRIHLFDYKGNKGEDIYAIAAEKFHRPSNEAPALGLIENFFKVLIIDPRDSNIYYKVNKESLKKRLGFSTEEFQNLVKTGEVNKAQLEEKLLNAIQIDINAHVSQLNSAIMREENCVNFFYNLKPHIEKQWVMQAFVKQATIDQITSLYNKFKTNDSSLCQLLQQTCKHLIETSEKPEFKEWYEIVLLPQQYQMFLESLKNFQFLITSIGKKEPEIFQPQNVKEQDVRALFENNALSELDLEHMSELDFQILLQEIQFPYRNVNSMIDKQKKIARNAFIMILTTLCKLALKEGLNPEGGPAIRRLWVRRFHLTLFMPDSMLLLSGIEERKEVYQSLVKDSRTIIMNASDSLRFEAKLTETIIDIATKDLTKLFENILRGR